MTTKAYLRVSSIGQDLEKNKSDILFLAHERNLGSVHFVEEKISGKVNWKSRKIFKLLNELKAGDNIIVSELSRLGRSMLEIMEILAIATEKKLNIYSVKGSWTLDNTIQSKLVAMCFSMASEIERDLIRSRTKEALAARKAQGVRLGRPLGKGKSKLDKYSEEIVALLNNGSSKRFVAKKYGVSEQGLFYWLKKNSLIETV